MQWKNLILLSSLFLMTSCTGLVAGWEAQKSGDYDEAMKQAAIALAKEPKNPDVYRLIATTHLARGNYDSAANAADFARTLDGGTEKTESLIRDIALAQKKWAAYCDSAQRSTDHEKSWSPQEQESLLAAYNQLNGNADAYGCLTALESSGQSPADAEKVKAAYAVSLASSGQTQKALEIEEKLSDPIYHQLHASRRLFALNRTDEGADKLRNYVGSASPSEKESRILEAIEVCEDYRKWALEGELLALSDNPQNDIVRGIVLRRQFNQAESDDILEKHFARQDRTAAQVLNEIEQLVDAGYAEPAARAYETCVSCIEDIQMSFKAAEVLYDAGQLSAANHILTAIGEAQATNVDLQLKIFHWYLARKLPQQALISGERAAKIGVDDEDFQLQLIETYLDARQVRAYERESAAYLEKQPAPAANARQAIAQIESKRSNWEGIIALLDPVLDDLTPKSQDLYIKSLRTIQKYPELLVYLDKINRYTPLDKSKFFLDPIAETEFNKSIEPMLSGSLDDQTEALFAIAEYYTVYKKDEEKVLNTLNDYLKIAGKNSDNYGHVIRFLKGYGMYDHAMDYAKQWQSDYPDDPEPYDILGQIYLENHQIPEADDSFTKLVTKQTHYGNVFDIVYNKYSQMHEDEAGLEWLENKVPAVLSTSDNAEYISALATVYKREYDNHRNDEKAYYFREKAIQNNKKMAELDSQKALSAALTLANLEDYDGACKAFEDANKQKIRFNAGQKRENIRAMIRAGKAESQITNTLSLMFCKNGQQPCYGNGESGKVSQTDPLAVDKEMFEMIELLEYEQSLYLGKRLLEKQLDNKNAQMRSKAYGYLVRIAMADGDTKQIRDYNQKLEKIADNNDDLHLRIAETALNIGDYDLAVHELTQVQMSRPDSREVIHLELKLANLAPDHKGAQSLAETTLDAAEGVYHRLDWISQFFEQTGDYPRALHYAEKAYAASVVPNNEMRRRLVTLNLLAGKAESDSCQDILGQLKSSAYWKSENIASMAEDAQKAGYPDLAQSWMREAIANAPDSEKHPSALAALKRRKLEMALESESDGQIAQSLEEAITAPVTEVMDPLRDNGSMLDAFEAIDLFEQNGEFEMAISSLLSVLEEYLQTRGVSATLRALQDYSNSAPGYESVVAHIMAQHALMGDNPCSAMGYVSELQSPEIWAHILIRCTDAQQNVLSAIEDLRSSMTQYRRTSFDNQLYQALLSAKKVDSAELYANTMGYANTPFEQFQRTFASSGALAGLKEVTKNPVEKERIRDVYTTLAAAGYPTEANEYAKEQMENIPEDMRTYISASAILLGSHDEVFVKNLPGQSPNDLPMLTDDESAQFISVDAIQSWLNDTPTSKLAPVIQTAVRCAFANPSQHDAILQAVEKEIDNRHNKTSLYTTLAQTEFEIGLHQDAYRNYQKLTLMVPASDYYYRMLSACEARIGKTDDAWNTAQAGARITPNLIQYWDETAKLHQTSPNQLRMYINDAQLALSPANPDILAERAGIALQDGASEQANAFAVKAYQSGKNRILPKLTNLYEKDNALASMPDEICSGVENTKLQCAARIELAKGNQQTAEEKTLLAAKTSPWPIQTYAEIAQKYIDLKQWPQAEQAIAQMMSNFPHAYTPYVSRAVYALAQNQLDDAWNDYLAARRLSLDTRPWIANLVRACAIAQNIDFAKRLYQSEIDLGTIDEDLWANTLTQTFLDPQNAQILSISQKQLAQNGLQFIEKVLPRMAYMGSDEKRLQMAQLTYIGTH